VPDVSMASFRCTSMRLKCVVDIRAFSSQR